MNDEDYDPTPEQQDIIDAFQSGDTVAAVALAGTGKTTTQRLCAEATRKRGLYLAFNKAIATEAEYLFPGRVKASTIHSLAYRNVELPRIGRKLARLEQRDYLPPWDVAKLLGIRDPLVLGDKQLKPTKLASLTREMVAKFCYSGDDQVKLDHVPFVRGLDAVHDADETVDAHGYLAETLLPYARDYWAEVSQPVDEGKIRFEHDHYLKVWALSRPVLDADFICVDEAQDLNGVVIRLINDQNAQLLICGDSNQQIYQWRGSVDAMDVLEAKHRLPLTQSWRFGPEVAEIANVFLHRLGSEYRIRGNPGKGSEVWEDDVTDPDSILCRTNAGTLDLLLAYQRMGKRVAMEGRRKELLDFCEAAEKMQRGQIVTHRDLQMFSSWSEVQDYANEGHDQAFALLVKLVGKYGALNLINALDEVVRPERADVQLSTAHSAKGLEWGRVQIGDDWEHTDTKGQVLPPGPGELRLRYVAVTRAKDMLGLGSLTRELGSDDESDEDAQG